MSSFFLKKPSSPRSSSPSSSSPFASTTAVAATRSSPPASSAFSMLSLSNRSINKLPPPILEEGESIPTISLSGGDSTPIISRKTKMVEGGKVTTPTLPTQLSTVVFYLNNISDICAGAIGVTGVKFCCRGSDCTIKLHKTNKCILAQPGLYIKANDTEVFITPHVSKWHLNDEMIKEFLQHSFNDDELKTKFAGYSNFADDEIMLKELPQRLDDLKYASTKTPSVKRCKLDLTQDLDEILKPSTLDEDAKAPSIETQQKTIEGILKILPLITIDYHFSQ